MRRFVTMTDRLAEKTSETSANSGSPVRSARDEPFGKAPLSPALSPVNRFIPSSAEDRNLNSLLSNKGKNATPSVTAFLSL